MNEILSPSATDGERWTWTGIAPADAFTGFFIKVLNSMKM